MSDNAWTVVGFIVCVLALIGAIILIYIGVTQKFPAGPPCTSNAQCNPTQSCSNGACIQVTCNSNSECTSRSEGIGQICSAGFCYQQACVETTDCPSGTVCSCSDGPGCTTGDPVCYPSGQTCGSDTDCWGSALICTGGKCAQCASNNDCPSGFCANGSCFDSCAGLTGICGTGTICLGDFCCPSSTSSRPCDSANICPTGEFCIAGVCTCLPGITGSVCAVNNDCQSRNCLEKRCVAFGAECANNFGTTGSPCTQANPYCANGKCGTSAVGAPCECFLFTGPGTCTNAFDACNITGVTGFTGTTQVSYCINNMCSLTPGPPGAQCTANGDCAPISGQQLCIQGRCGAF